MAIEVEVKALIQNPVLFAEQLELAGYVPTGFIAEQLNHYFKGDGNLSKAVAAVTGKDSKQVAAMLKPFSKKISVRTRQSDGANTLLVIKGSTTDPENGDVRSELELEATMDIEELDAILTDVAGFSVTAFWSRERTTYQKANKTITIDRNGGYGFLSEFEIIVEKEEDRAAALAEVEAEMAVFGLEKLDPARLARMYEYYNQNWQMYYRTHNVFIVA